MRKVTLAILILGLAVPLAACGGSTQTKPTPAGSSAPTAQARPTDKSTTAPASSPAPVSQSEESTYTVQSGDTLYAIAIKFGTTVDAIVAANKIANPDVIDVGQKLIIPKPAR